MQKLLYILIVMTTLMACKEEPDRRAVVGETARLYYQQLLEGKYDAFVDATAGSKEFSQSYRNQLIENAKMFIGQQKSEHQGGIKEVKVANCKIDDKSKTAQVFLIFRYADSTEEEVVVPMVQKDSVWYIK